MKWIVKSLLEIILDVLNGIFEFLSQPFLSNFSLDIGAKLTDGGKATDFSTAMGSIFQGNSFFDSAFPGMVKFCTALMILSIMIVIMIMIIELLKAMTLGPGEAEHPVSIIGRSLMAGAGVGFSYAIFVMFEWAFNKIYLQFAGINLSTNTDTTKIFSASGLFSTKTVKECFVPDIGGDIGDCIILLIAIIALIMVVVQFIKLLLSVLERYVLLGIFFYTSPLAFSTLASKNTSAIFKSWFRMIFSQFLLMIFGVFFINVFMLSMENGMGHLYLTNGASNEMKYLCFIFALYAWLLIGQKVNSYLSEIGLSAAQSAGNLLGAVTGGVATVASAYLGARGAAKGLAVLDSKRATPKTFAGQQIARQNAEAKAMVERGENHPGGLQGVLADDARANMATKDADTNQKIADLKEDKNVLRDNAKAQSDAMKQGIADNKERAEAGLTSKEGMKNAAEAKVNGEKMTNAKYQAMKDQGLTSDASIKDQADIDAADRKYEYGAERQSQKSLGRMGAEAEVKAAEGYGGGAGAGGGMEQYSADQAKGKTFGTMNSAAQADAAGSYSSPGGGSGQAAYVQDQASVGVQRTEAAVGSARDYNKVTGGNVFRDRETIGAANTAAEMEAVRSGSGSRSTDEQGVYNQASKRGSSSPAPAEKPKGPDPTKKSK